MALVLANRVQETTTTTGTGTVTLAGAVSGYQSFAAIGDTNTTYYTITSGTAWEVGIGTYTSAGTTLSRDTVLSSSAGGTTKITLAGTSTVFVTYPAEKSVNLDASGNATALGIPASGTVTNLTGTASININGTVGATTANTGAFTSLSYTTTLTGGTGIVNLGSSQFYKDASGNVGIGVTPSYRLHVVGGYSVIGAHNTATLVASSATGGAAFSWNKSAGSAETNIANIFDNAPISFEFLQKTGASTANTLYQMASTSHIFYTANAERMRLSNAGGVSIGTTTDPGATNLLVAGTISGTVKAYKEFVTAASSSTAYTVDLSTANIFNISMTGNCTFTFTNPPVSGTSFSFTLILKQDATGSRTATWPASVKYPNASTPTLTTTASKTDIFNFITVDGGTTYFGALSLANM